MQKFLSLLAVILLASSCATSRVYNYATPTTRPLVAPMRDSLEGCNRAVHVADEQLRRRVFQPVGHAWRLLFPEAVRDSLGNFFSNIGYPLRGATHLLGGKFQYAWEDTKRFAINTTIGVLGFMDPAAEKYGLPELEGGFATTFDNWGIGQGTYMELPFLGGASVRDHVGTAADFFLNPLGYLAPSSVTYPLSAGETVNSLSYKAPSISQFYLTNDNHYEMQKLLTYYTEAVRDEDYAYDADSDQWCADDSFGYLMLAPQNKLFLHQGFTRKVSLPGLGKVTYTRWLRRNSDKMVVILPGLGSHRLDNSVLALAELLNRQGYTVAAISSTMTPDFSAKLTDGRPAGYLPEDAKVLARVVRCIVKDVEHSGRAPKKMECSVLGYSLGALNALFIAASEVGGKIAGDLEIARYVAINPPADPLGTLAKLDRFFAIPENWDGDTASRVRDVAMRLAAYLEPTHNNPVPKAIPLTHEESLFLVGLNMRFNLASYLLAEQAKNPTGLFQEDATAFFCRNALFAEALNIRFADYLERVVKPWYQKNGYPECTVEALSGKCTLASIADRLTGNPRVSIFQNANDPLLTGGQAEWFSSGLKATVYPHGGHLGNMADPNFLKAILLVLANSFQQTEIKLK